MIRAAVGFSDVEANVPLDDVIGMPGGSTGKTFAAALNLLLVEDGKLSLDDLMSKYLSELPWSDRLPNAEEILSTTFCPTRRASPTGRSSRVVDRPVGSQFVT